MSSLLYAPPGDVSGNAIGGDVLGLRFEDDPFWDDLRSWAGRTLKRIRTPGTAERKWTIGIGKGSLTAGGGLLGLGLAGPPGGVIGSALGTVIGHGIYPDRFAGEDDFALEELAENAAEAATDEGAIAYVRAMIPIVIRTCPGSKVNLIGNSHIMMNALKKIVRALRYKRFHRPMIRLVPSILRASIRKLQKAERKGKKVTPGKTYRVVLSQARSLLRNPRRSAKLLGRNLAMCRHYRRYGQKSSGYGKRLRYRYAKL